MEDLKSVDRPRRLVGRLVAVALLSAALATVGFISTAGADTPSDPRATFVNNANATTCAAVGATGTLLLVDGANNGSDANVSGTVSGGGTTLNITELNPVTIHAIVVKGGNGYNVYTEDPPVSDMISPLNNGGNIPTISHWFVCYDAGAPVTTTTPTTTGGGGAGGGGGGGAGTTGAASAATSVVAQPSFTG